MPRDGQGNFSPPLNNWNPAVDGNEADPAGWNQLLADLTSALSQSVSADGQTMLTGNLKMGGNQLQSLGPPAGNGYALRRDQLIKGPNIASASTIEIPNEGAIFDVTGTANISEIAGGFAGRATLLRFIDKVTLTHSPDLILPSAAPMTTSAGEILLFVKISSSAWALVTSSSPAPSLLRATVITTVGSNSFVKLPEARFIEFEVQAGGGAGGGARGGEGAAAAPGGGAGGYAHGLIPASLVAASVVATVGAGGAGSVGDGGGNGGASSFGAHATCSGGVGGAFDSNGTGTAFGIPGGVGGDTSSYGASITALSPSGNRSGAQGGASLRNASTIRYAGFGAATKFGAGGWGRDGDLTGLSGIGWGSGGSGAGATTANRAGGDGRSGVIIVREWA